MNIYEFVHKIVKQVLNEQAYPNKSDDKLEYLLLKYQESVPENPDGGRNYPVLYTQLNPLQQNIMGRIMEKLAKSCIIGIQSIYNTTVSQHISRETAEQPSDVAQTYLMGGRYKDFVLVSKNDGESEANQPFGITYDIGQYLNKCEEGSAPYTRDLIIRYIVDRAQKFGLHYYRQKLNKPDSPLIHDNLRPDSFNEMEDTGYKPISKGTQILPDEVVYIYDKVNKKFVELNLNEPILADKDNKYFRLIGYGKEKQSASPRNGVIMSDITTQNDIDNSNNNPQFNIASILNLIEDGNNNLKPQERTVLKCLVDVYKTGVNKNRKNIMLNLSDTQKKQEIYREIGERLGIPFETVRRVVSAAILKAKSIINPQISQNTSNFTEKFGKTNNKEQTIDNNQSRKRNKNLKESNNMKKVLIKESVLKSLIFRAINESLNEGGGKKTWDSVVAWARAVVNGKDPLHCHEFSGFYDSLIEDSYCENSIKLGFAKESQNQSAGGKKALQVDYLFNDRPKISIDVMTDFLTGVDCVNRDSSMKDSFLGDVKVEDKMTDEIKIVPFCSFLAKIISESPNNQTQFYTYFGRRLQIYASHYCRKHYNEIAMRWAVGSSLYNDNTGDDEGEDITDAGIDNTDMSNNETNPVINIHEPNRDEYTGVKKDDDNDNSPENTLKDTSTNYDRFYNRMFKLIEKMIADDDNNLAPQERKILQCIVDICRTGVSQERLDSMEGMSDTQKRQVIYDEAAERLGIPVESVKRSISSAINKARDTKQAKMLQERKQMKEQLVNEVMNKILNKFCK